MARTDQDYNIEVIRGNMLPLRIKSNNKDGTPYAFQVGDIIRFKIIKKKDCECVVLQKDVEVKEVSTFIDIDITSEEMKIGDLINKPVDYWYEVELNPDTDRTQTILGYDKKKGAKILTLTPEGSDKK